MQLISKAHYLDHVPLSRCINAHNLVDKDIALNKLYKEAPKRDYGASCSTFLDLRYSRLDENIHATEKPYDYYSYPIIDPRNWVFNGFKVGKFATSTEGSSRDGRSSRYDMKDSIEMQNADLRKAANKIRSVAAFNA